MAFPPAARGVRVERRADRRFRRRSRPDPDVAGEPVALDPQAEVVLVLPLDLGHREEALDELGMSGVARVSRRRFVLRDVAPL
jgi:hypothetical protein